jgi:hypothetical protein
MFQPTGTLDYEEPQFSEKFRGAVSGRNHRHATLIFGWVVCDPVMTGHAAGV